VSWLIVAHAFTVAYPVCYNAGSYTHHIHFSTGHTHTSSLSLIFHFSFSGRILLQAVPLTTQHILDESLRDVRILSFTYSNLFISLLTVVVVVVVGNDN
jgi:hypothetical protein